MQRRFLLILVCASLLGLLASALVYRVVEEHGGSIEVRSRVGEGTTFVLTLPAPEGAARR